MRREPFAVGAVTHCEALTLEEAYRVLWRLWTKGSERRLQLYCKNSGVAI